MGDLPAVVDDLKNAEYTCKMMGILPENTFTLRDVSHQELEAHFDWLKHRVKVLTMNLKNTTGICGIRFYL